MAVLVEAISVIVRRDAIRGKYPGGWQRFVATVPNGTLCYDDDLARVGFMSPPETESYIKRLTRQGLTFLSQGQAVDIAVADQQRGLNTPCDWLEFAHLSMGTDGQVAGCWLFEGPRFGFGTHLPGKSFSLATPPAWDYENSLSKEFTFIPS